MYRQRFPDDPGMHVPHQETYTNVKYRQNATFFERVKSSLVAILIGLMLILVASVLLFWNEGRAVQTAQSLDEGMRILVHLDTTDVAFENNNLRLVYLQGQLSSEESLFDPVYQISIRAARFRRIIEMYQWVEHEQKREIKEGDRTREETEYSYSLEWNQEVIKSDSFYSTVGHENPNSMPYRSETQVASVVKVGAFHLSSALVDQISDFRLIPPGTSASPKDPSLMFFNGYYYHGSPQNPKVGDLRVKIEAAGILPDSNLGPPTDVTIIAKQKGSRLEGYQTEAGDILEILYTELLSPKDIFSKKHADNTLMTWAIRFGGWLLMFVGFGCLTSIITTLVDWIPLVRDLVSVGVGTLNMALSVSLSLTVIALGWIRYRPWLGCTILFMAFVPYILARFRKPSPLDTRYRNA
ncbi:transmembrane protein 43-like [Pomacea canaliculata]|uniref:transmembrane protein 43-like n=1 Tax=Pomacea canaliculata TaxID=400727 RepID=UPI000D73FAA2|nr:transmembrane protein 43-like [Pomacea canaliculata]XP_025107088.1 transmembrane protein 43-like [Pomacea canaliculata]XP_025107089.1 transmembrane protein 43-like [Pomacea canaliculata]